MGIWSSIGTSLEEVSESLRTGKSGVGIDPRRTAHGYQSPLTGIVPVPDLSDAPLRRAQRICMAEQTQYAYMAVSQAIQQAHLTDLHKCALIVSNDSSNEACCEGEDLMNLHHDTRRLGAGLGFRSLNSSVSMSLASILGIGGLTLTLSAACAGGGHAVGLAYSLIKSGQIDCAIVVGAQEVGVHAYTAFDALGVFSRRSDDPQKASRPFDKQRDGLVPSGGAACVIIESPEHAAMGNRRAIAHVSGYGFSTSPDIVSPSSDGIFRSMSNAIFDANIVASDIDMVMTHATSTQAGDHAEAEALLSLSLWLPPYEGGAGVPIEKPWVINTKCLTGHECWMSGVSQIVYAILQMQGGFVAPHINLVDPDPAARLLNIPRTPQPLEGQKHVCLCNAFGFGGTNSTIILNYD